MKNYKTTVVGILAAIALAIQPFLAKGGINWPKDWPQIVGAALVGALGYLAKDHDVTGGTRTQPSN